MLYIGVYVQWTEIYVLGSAQEHPALLISLIRPINFNFDFNYFPNASFFDQIHAFVWKHRMKNCRTWSQGSHTYWQFLSSLVLERVYICPTATLGIDPSKSTLLDSLSFCSKISNGTRQRQKRCTDDLSVLVHASMCFWSMFPPGSLADPWSPPMLHQDTMSSNTFGQVNDPFATLMG